MYRIRFHGRGGQGIKTASRILGRAFFLEGYEVQDAPRYGAERRGAPIFAYVRASRMPVFERGNMSRPGLVVVADPSLVQVPAAGVLQGFDAATLLLIASTEASETWKHRLNLAGPVLTLRAVSEYEDSALLVGAACVGAAARLVGTISRAHLVEAIYCELEGFGSGAVDRNVDAAVGAFDSMAIHDGRVRQASPVHADLAHRPDWIDLSYETPGRAAALIHAGPTSDQVETGLWRTQRPVIDYEHCHHCIWVCGTLCPDAAIVLGVDGEPVIDLDHCKGCLICAAVCPSHAIRIEPESPAQPYQQRNEDSP